MAESKEFQLDEPYYGPSILPSRSSALKSRRTDLYSMLCSIVKAASISLIIVGIIVLTLWLIYQPKSIKVDAESASLSNFSLSPSSPKPLLSYNLALNFTFRNPNRKYSMYYERIICHVLYGGSTIGSNGYPRLYQMRESAKAMGMKFEGRSALAEGKDYEREKEEGFFRVRVRMDMTLRLKMMLVKSIRFKPSVDCALRIPAPGNRTSLAAGFAPTECAVNNFY